MSREEAATEGDRQSEVGSAWTVEKLDMELEATDCKIMT